jgi:hypothetical protein
MENNRAERRHPDIRALGVDEKKDTQKPAMRPHKGEPDGMERDSRGHAVPMNERLPEDRAKAKRAGKRRKTEQT